ncbi:MAG: hypothetical protein IPK13_20280 [Deltaproteobacteria bacterium]|nr:hypothetical protein [Deltaproteobacteria bacterium]
MSSSALPISPVTFPVGPSSKAPRRGPGAAEASSSVMNPGAPTLVPSRGVRAADAFGAFPSGPLAPDTLRPAQNPLVSMLRGVKAAFRDIKDGFAQHPIGTSAVLAAISGLCWGLSKSPYPRLAWLVSGLTIGSSLTQIGVGIRTVASDGGNGSKTDLGWERVGRGLAGLGLSATTAGAARMLAETPSLGAIQFLDDAPTLFATAKSAIKTSSPSSLEAGSEVVSGADDGADGDADDGRLAPPQNDKAIIA